MNSSLPSIASSLLQVNRGVAGYFTNIVLDELINLEEDDEELFIIQALTALSKAVDTETLHMVMNNLLIARPNLSRKINQFKEIAAFL